MVLSKVWSLILHYNAKSHSPLTMTGVVIVQRLTIEVQKVIPKRGSGCSLLKVNKEARLVERKFILDASMCVWWGEGGHLSKG